MTELKNDRLHGLHVHEVEVRRVIDCSGAGDAGS